jgi:murein L,D-transpeptidase YcbB/YkuD
MEVLITAAATVSGAVAFALGLRWVDQSLRKQASSILETPSVAPPDQRKEYRQVEEDIKREYQAYIDRVMNERAHSNTTSQIIAMQQAQLRAQQEYQRRVYAPTAALRYAGYVAPAHVADATVTRTETPKPSGPETPAQKRARIKAALNEAR